MALMRPQQNIHNFQSDISDAYDAHPVEEYIRQVRNTWDRTGISWCRLQG